MMEITSDGAGVLIPRLTIAQRDHIGSPAAGLLIYCSDDANYHFFNGTLWQVVGVPDGDGSDTNEIQTLFRSDTTVSLSQGGGSFMVVDADADPTDEVQFLSRDGNLLRLGRGGSASLVDGDDDPTAPGDLYLVLVDARMKRYPTSPSHLQSLRLRTSGSPYYEWTTGLLGVLNDHRDEWIHVSFFPHVDLREPDHLRLAVLWALERFEYI